MNIDGKSALITGGGSGIGKATALRLARGGASVVVADISAALGQATVDDITKAGGRASLEVADARQDGDLVRVFEATTRLHGRIDIVINNAGILTGTPAFPETPAEQWRRVIELNLIAVIRGTQLAIQAMRQKGGGVIVNTASVAGLNAWNMDPVYSASKGGVVLFTKALAGLKVSDNIRVNCVCPTLVQTPLVSEAADPRISNLIRITTLTPEQVADAVLRLIEDEDLAGAALRLLPNEAPALV